MKARTSQITNNDEEDKTYELDRFDLAILHLLQADASISNVTLAEKVSLSPPACLRRVERLKEIGLITGIVALLNPEPLNAGLVVLIGVVLDRSNPGSFKDFEEAVHQISGCMECYVVTGEFDYILKVRTKNNQSFNKLHAEQLLLLPGVRQIRSFIALRDVVSTTQIPF